MISKSSQIFISQLRKNLPELIVYKHEHKEEMECISVRFNWQYPEPDGLTYSNVIKELGKLGYWANSFSLVFRDDLLNHKIVVEVTGLETYPGTNFLQSTSINLSMCMEFGIKEGVSQKTCENFAQSIQESTHRHQSRINQAIRQALKLKTN